MKIRTRLALAAAAVVAASALAQMPAPAQATTAAPVVDSWRVYPNAGRVAIQIQGASDIWGMRKYAQEADAQIGGLRVYTSGTCAQRPWATCVKVRTVWQPDSGWYGVARWKGKYQREILLNRATRKTNRYAVAAHEFTHALGLTHHRMYGVVGTSKNVIHLSLRERQALNAAY